MSEQPKRGRGRPPSPQKLKNPQINFSVPEVLLKWIDEQAPLVGESRSSFIVRMVRFCRDSLDFKYQIYQDSGQQGREEGAENAADLAEARGMIERGEVGIE